MNLCDMCGKPIKAGTSLGGAIVCRLCAVDLSDKMDQMFKEGKIVYGLRIARKIYRERYSKGKVIISDFPKDLWDKVIERSADKGDSFRELIIKSIYAVFQGPGE